MKILLIQQKMIGDVLVSSILCELLKQELETGEIHYLINEQTFPVIQNNPFVDEIVIFTKKAQQSKIHFYQFLKAISQENYDVVIDVYGKLESNLISLFSGAAIKISHHKWYTNFIYSHRVNGAKNIASEIGLAIENRVSFLAPILEKKVGQIPPPKIYLSEQEIVEAKNYLLHAAIDLSKPVLMLGILGSGKHKSYPLPFFAEFVNQIAELTNATLLFNYIPAQQNEAQHLFDLCSEAAKAKIKFDVFAPSLRKFLGILHHCNALIGNEGGAIHMAKALQVPTFSIYSPWVTKLAWHTFNENTQNIAVHLKDYMPQLFENKSRKELKQQSIEMYEFFEPRFIQEELTTFLKSEVLAYK